MVIGRAFLLASISALAITGARAGAEQATPNDVAETNQTSPDPDQLRVEEIVVTARRRSENMQNVPISIAAVTSAQLTSSGVTNVMDLQKAVPGVQLYRVSTAVTPFIRGIGTNAAIPGLEAPTAIYIDGVYSAGKSGNAFDLPNVDRIEVLKGPQGTLFGRNATGGAIQIVTRDPGQDVEIEAEAGFGRFDEIRARAYVATPITDTLAVAMGFSGRWDDGFIYNRTLDEMANPSKNVSALAKLLWQPTDELTVRLSGSYFYNSDPTFNAAHAQKGTIPTAVGLGFGTTYSPYEVRSDHPLKLETRTRSATLNVNYDFDVARLVSISGYLRSVGDGWNNGDASDATFIYASSRQPSEQFSQEIQLQSRGDGRFDWLVGGYYMWMTDGYGNLPGSNIAAINVPLPIRPIDLTRPGASVTGTFGLVTTRSLAAFAETNYKLTEKLRLTTGFRYSTESKAFNGETYRYTAVPLAGNPPLELRNTVPGSVADGLTFGRTTLATINAKKRYSNPTWRIALNFEPVDDINTYVSYNRGFKSGGYNTTSVTPNQAALKPETLDAYEVGVKSELFDRRVRFNVAAFHYKYRDIQVTQTTAGRAECGRCPNLRRRRRTDGGRKPVLDVESVGKLAGCKVHRLQRRTDQTPTHRRGLPRSGTSDISRWSEGLAAIAGTAGQLRLPAGCQRRRYGFRTDSDGYGRCRLRRPAGLRQADLVGFALLQQRL